MQINEDLVGKNKTYQVERDSLIETSDQLEAALIATKKKKAKLEGQEPTLNSQLAELRKLVADKRKIRDVKMDLEAIKEKRSNIEVRYT